MHVILLLLLAASPVAGPLNVEHGKSAVIRVPLAESGDDYSWSVQPEDVQWVGGQNKQEAFAIVLDMDKTVVVSFVSFDKKIHRTHIVTVGTNPPSPGPVPPLPPPGPGPLLPDGKYKLAESAKTWAITLVPSEHRGKSKVLADQFRAVASMIGAGVLKDPQAILSELRNRNNMTLGTSMEAWKPFGNQLSATLSKFSADGKLIPPEDFRIAFEEVATGLEAVK